VPYRIVVWQLAATAVLTTGLFLWEFPGRSFEAPMLGFDQTVSALAAGMASALPAGLYAWRASVERSATGFLLQGVAKFALTLVLIAACIIVLRPAAAAFFGTLILMQAMYIAAPLWFDRSARKAESRAEIRR
jgi:F0F1-type ATP synthase assembly protein I